LYPPIALTSAFVELTSKIYYNARTQIILQKYEFPILSGKDTLMIW